LAVSPEPKRRSQQPRRKGKRHSRSSKGLTRATGRDEWTQHHLGTLNFGLRETSPVSPSLNRPKTPRSSRPATLASDSNECNGDFCKNYATELLVESEAIPPLHPQLRNRHPAEGATILMPIKNQRVGKNLWDTNEADATALPASHPYPTRTCALAPKV